MRVRVFISFTLLLLSSCGGDKQEAKRRRLPLEGNGCVASAASGPASLQQAEEAPRPGRRFLVKLNPNQARAKGAGLLRAMANSSAQSSEAIGPDLALVKTNEELLPEELKARFPEGAVSYVEEDSLVQADFVSRDASLHKQWAHEKIGSAQAWDISRGGPTVIVAVVDSGADYHHEDLAANIWVNPNEIPDNGLDDDGDGYIDDIHGWNFVADTNAPLDDNGHGTHVAGTIGAVGDNGIGISGHAPIVKLMPLKFLNANGSGYKSDAIRGIDYAIRHGAKIINNSWGSGERSTALAEAIERARAAGVLFVAAAGNSGLNNDRFNHFPSNYSHDNLVRVAASDKEDNFASFSNYGPTRVDLAAPGVSIYSTQFGDRYRFLSGTSMAAPLVSGVLATILAVRPDFTYLQAKGTLLESTDAVGAMAGKTVTGGRVNAANALSMAVGLPANWVPPSHIVGDCR